MDARLRTFSMRYTILSSPFPQQTSQLREGLLASCLDQITFVQHTLPLTLASPLPPDLKNGCKLLRGGIRSTVQRFQNAVDGGLVIIDDHVFVVFRPLHADHVKAPKLDVAQLRSPQIQPLHFVGRECLTSKGLAVKQHIDELARHDSTNWSTAPNAEFRRSADRKLVSEIVVPHTRQSWHRAPSKVQSSMLLSQNRSESRRLFEKSIPFQRSPRTTARPANTFAFAAGVTYERTIEGSGATNPRRSTRPATIESPRPSKESPRSSFFHVSALRVGSI